MDSSMFFLLLIKSLVHFHLVSYKLVQYYRELKWIRKNAGSLLNLNEMIIHLIESLIQLKNYTYLFLSLVILTLFYHSLALIIIIIFLNAIIILVFFFVKTQMKIEKGHKMILFTSFLLKVIYISLFTLMILKVHSYDVKDWIGNIFLGLMFSLTVFELLALKIYKFKCEKAIQQENLD